MTLGPLMIDLAGPSLNAQEAEWLAQPAVGGVILFTRNFQSLEQLQDLVAAIRALRKPELVIAVDQEGGRVQRFAEPFTRIPPMRALGRYFDVQPEQALETAREIGWLLASELRAVDIDLSFTPVVDVDRGLADVIGDRALHDDAEVVARLAVELMAGLKQGGMAAIAKHFPSHAGAIADSHTALATDGRDYSALLDDLVPYRQLIAAGLRGVMAAHVSFTALDPLPAGFSRWWIETQLRGELGFHGAIFSDDLAMAGAGLAKTCAERAEMAMRAGCDVVLLCNRHAEIPETIARLNTMTFPASQLRLIRMRGEGELSWSALRATSRWQAVRERIATLFAEPTFELEG